MSEDMELSLEDYFFLEAKERCYEIEVKALKEFEREKKKLFDQEKNSITEAFEKRVREETSRRRILKSAENNTARLQKMEARNTVMMKIYDEAELQICRRVESEKDFYKQLMKKLMVQAFLKIFEHKVYIRCLERDVQLVESLIPEAVEEFKAFIKKELDIDFSLEVGIESHHLELRNVTPFKSMSIDDHKDSRIHKSEEEKRCFGGVVVLNEDRSILCKNTLDTRMELCFQESLPDIRSILFNMK